MNSEILQEQQSQIESLKRENCEMQFARARNPVLDDVTGIAVLRSMT